jgi:enamine deaminase RidA (YjgF/YER057c/UK114 family)
MAISDDVIEQAHQAFGTIARSLAAARCSFADIVRVTYYITDRDDYETLMPVFKQYLGPHPPAATALIAQLVDPRMKIEIEVTAQRPVTPRNAGEA